MMLNKFVQLFKSCRKIALKHSSVTDRFLQARSRGCTETAGTTGSSCFGGRVMVDWRLLGYNDIADIYIYIFRYILS